MLGSNNLVAFVVTTDRERATQFYRDTLGLRLVKQDGHAAVFEVNGALIRVTIMKSHTPPQHTVLGWQVPDIQAAAAQMAASGIRFERYPHFEQDSLGIWNVPGGQDKVAWFKDPDGNTLSISQHA